MHIRCKRSTTSALPIRDKSVDKMNALANQVSAVVGWVFAIPSIILLPKFVNKNAATSYSGNDDDDDGNCELIGTFSLLTQAGLGLLCLSCLVVKRYYEYPLRRSWPVWFMDVLKQLIGAMGVHVFNVLLSILKTQPSSGEISGAADDGGDSPPTSSDPCDWYFLNIVLDCTIGVYVLFLVFNLTNKICKKHFHMTEIDSGNYGSDPQRPSIKAYVKQLGIYFTCLMITKFILYGLVECFETQLLWICSNLILIWLRPYPEEVEIFIVLFIVPIFMNCLQLVLIDNFIQNQMFFIVNERLHQEYDGQGDESESFIRNEIDGILTLEGYSRAILHKDGESNSNSMLDTNYGATEHMER